MKTTLRLFVAWIVFATACLGASEAKMLVIPLSPLGEQKMSEKMRKRISALESEETFLALSSWGQIPELPAWAFDRKKREIGFVFANLAATDAYRYAVILGRMKELIIVRAGGIAGTYEIFESPKKPAKAPELRSAMDGKPGQK